MVAFARISTHPRAYRQPLTPHEAREQISEWLSAPAAWVPAPTAGHWQILEGLIARYQVSANMAADAELAALAIEHGLTVVSADSDFARFPEVSWTNPIEAW